MQVITTVREMMSMHEGWSATPGLGFVPTMGYLHEGHLSLLRQARRENQVLAASIFVNPTQFGPHEDFTSYPRNLERDLRLLTEVGADVVFAPTPQEMYPQGFAT